MALQKREYIITPATDLPIDRLFISLTGQERFMILPVGVSSINFYAAEPCFCNSISIWFADMEA